MGSDAYRPVSGSRMAAVAKWLRLRFVVPAFVGSTPISCPIIKNKVKRVCYPRGVADSFLLLGKIIELNLIMS